jgi:hypothetical protein
MEQVGNVMTLNQPYLESYLYQIPLEILQDTVLENFPEKNFSFSGRPKNWDNFLPKGRPCGKFR